MKWKTADINGTEAVEDGIKPLAVDVYFESFCPDSVKFITEQLYPTYEKLLGKNIFTVDLIPYGNAKVNYYYLLIYHKCLYSLMIK